MELTIILLALNALSTLPQAQAWTFVWRNATNNSFVEHSNGAMPCTKVSNPKGMLFEYDSEDQPFAISLFGNSDCSGTAGGYASNYLSKNASTAIDSFKVDSTTTTTATSSSSVQPTTSAAEAAASSQSGSDMSGGTIAGIVIGVVVGVVIIGGMLFFLGRRRQKPPRNPATSMGMGFAPSGFGSPDTHTSPLSFGEMAALETKKRQQSHSSAPESSNGPVRVVELPGNYQPAELGNYSERNELEGQVRSPVSP
ncbi:hypothetical protein N7532_002073 [Penicillium argentinense]|uniref:Mid2 domain-containing protein n=1 Tax=Penicillium argentinense TaxID=1131581 RepID=A0A9W9KN16_9EURO|nr:uncharacterized protein N7532_002073 [Penicillium argentinense]KAJ5111538.1 hypothetical protein N7532_002073 [Penicillium argentinense]